jgi:hypothetical protein
MVRRTPFYTSITKAAEPTLTGLPRVESYLSSSFPMLPAHLLARAGSFFRWATLSKNAEAIVLLFLNQETGEWTMDAPSQTVPGHSAMSLRYDPSSIPRPPGTLLYGTIHSHCHGDAFHSSTDTHDEQWGDGLHVTFGQVHKDVPDLAASFVSNTTRFKYEPHEVMDPFVIRPNNHPVEWQTRHRQEAWKHGIKDWYRKNWIF